MKCDAIVAGAGLWGCTIARRLAEAGRQVLVLEKRRAVGGNCRCRTEKGIEVHLYGSHIFHTSNEEVWKFVNRFVTFNDYRHSVLACTRKTGGENRSTKEGFHYYHLPIGCTLLKEFFGREIKPSEMTEPERQEVFEAFIRGYTSKQWGMAPEDVDPSVIARLKVRDTDSTDYFDDPHQGIPIEGYNELFNRMLDHPNITVRCNRTVKVEKTGGGGERLVAYDVIRKVSYPLSTSTSSLHLYYSGPLDALFYYRYGALPWRTLRFETEHLPRRDFQGATVVNYSDASVPYTRIHEFRHYHPEAKGAFAKPQGTIITREYSDIWRPGDEPYYPIDNADSRALHAKYQAEVDKLNNPLSTSTSSFHLTVGGRLGEYRYYDMDKSIAAALAQEI